MASVKTRNGNVAEDLKVRGYWPSASRLSDALSLCVRQLGGFDLCIV